VKGHLGGRRRPAGLGAHRPGRHRARLRDLGRLISIESGTVELTSKELVLRNISTRHRRRGHLFIGWRGCARGGFAIKSLYPKLRLGQVELPLKGEHLSYRVPNVVEIDDLVFPGLTGSLDEGLTLSGEWPSGLGSLRAGFRGEGPSDIAADQRVLGAAVL